MILFFLSALAASRRPNTVFACACIDQCPSTCADLYKIVVTKDNPNIDAGLKPIIASQTVVILNVDDKNTSFVVSSDIISESNTTFQTYNLSLAPAFLKINTYEGAFITGLSFYNTVTEFVSQGDVSVTINDFVSINADINMQSVKTLNCKRINVDFFDLMKLNHVHIIDDTWASISLDASESGSGKMEFGANGFKLTFDTKSVDFSYNKIGCIFLTGNEFNLSGAGDTIPPLNIFEVSSLSFSGTFKQSAPGYLHRLEKTKIALDCPSLDLFISGRNVELALAQSCNLNGKLNINQIDLTTTLKSRVSLTVSESILVTILMQFKNENVDVIASQFGSTQETKTFPVKFAIGLLGASTLTVTDVFVNLTGDFLNNINSLLTFADYPTDKQLETLFSKDWSLVTFPLNQYIDDSYVLTFSPKSTIHGFSSVPSECCLETYVLIGEKSVEQRIRKRVNPSTILKKICYSALSKCPDGYEALDISQLASLSTVIKPGMQNIELLLQSPLQELSLYSLESSQKDITLYIVYTGELLQSISSIHVDKDIQHVSYLMLEDLYFESTMTLDFPKVFLGNVKTKENIALQFGESTKVYCDIGSLACIQDATISDLVLRDIDKMTFDNSIWNVHTIDDKQIPLKSSFITKFSIFEDNTLELNCVSAVTEMKGFNIITAGPTIIKLTGFYDKITKFDPPISIDHSNYPVEIYVNQPYFHNNITITGTGEVSIFVEYETSDKLCVCESDACNNCPSEAQTHVSFADLSTKIIENTKLQLSIVIVGSTAESKPTVTLEAMKYKDITFYGSEAQYLVVDTTKTIDDIRFTSTTFRLLNLYGTGTGSLKFGEVIFEQCTFDNSFNIDLSANQLTIQASQLVSLKSISISDNIYISGELPASDVIVSFGETPFAQDLNQLISYVDVPSSDISLEENAIKIGKITFNTRPKVSGIIIPAADSAINVAVTSLNARKMDINATSKCSLTFKSTAPKANSGESVVSLISNQEEVAIGLNSDNIPLEIINTEKVTINALTSPVSISGAIYVTKQITVDSTRTEATICNFEGGIDVIENPEDEDSPLIYLKGVFVQIITKSIQFVDNLEHKLLFQLSMSEKSIGSIQVTNRTYNVSFDSRIYIAPTFTGPHEDSFFQNLLSVNHTVIKASRIILSANHQYEVYYKYPEDVWGTHGFKNTASVFEPILESGPLVPGSKGSIDIVSGSRIPSEIPVTICYEEKKGSCKGEYIFYNQSFDKLADMGSFLNPATKSISIEGRAKNVLIRLDNLPSIKKLKVRVYTQSYAINLTTDGADLDNLTLQGVIIANENITFSNTNLLFDNVKFSYPNGVVITDSVNLTTDESIAAVTNLSGNNYTIIDANIITFYSNRLQIRFSGGTGRPLDLPYEKFKKVYFEQSTNGRLWNLMKRPDYQGGVGINITMQYNGSNIDLASNFSTDEVLVHNDGIEVSCSHGFYTAPNIFTDYKMVQNKVLSTKGPIDLPDNFEIDRDYSYDMSKVNSDKRIVGKNIISKENYSIVLTGRNVISTVEASTFEAFNTVNTITNFSVHDSIVLHQNSNLVSNVTFGNESVYNLTWIENKIPEIKNVESEPAQINIIFEGNNIDHTSYNRFLYKKAYNIISGKITCETTNNIKFISSNNELFAGNTSVFDIRCSNNTIYMIMNKKFDVPDPDDQDDGKGKNKAGVIAGSVIGVLIGVAIIVVVVIFVIKKKRGDTTMFSSLVSK